jgi:hypothetical protein
LAASKVPRPVITAPVDMISSTIWLLTSPNPPTASFGWSPTPWGGVPGLVYTGPGAGSGGDGIGAAVMFGGLPRVVLSGDDE